MDVMLDTSCSKQGRGSLGHREINVQKWFFPLSKFSWKAATSLQMLSSRQTPQVLQLKSKKEHFEGPGRVVKKVDLLQSISIAMDIESKMSLHAIFTQSLECRCMQMSGGLLCVNSSCNNGLMPELPLLGSARTR